MKYAVLIFSFFALAGVAHAEETMGEKAKATVNDAKRATKKGAHRVKEAVCMKGDAKCLQEKAQNRLKEGKDYVEDKAGEVKDKVD